MNYTKLRESTRGLRDLRPVTKHFGKTISNKKIKALYVALSLSRFFRLYVVFNLIFNKIIRRHVIDSPRVGFVLSKNQNKILLKIRELGFDFPVFFFNVNSSVNNSDKYISNKLVLLAVLATKNNNSLLIKVAKDDILVNDLVRVFRNVGMYKVYKVLLQNTHTVISFNDHSLYNVLLYDIAKELNSKTVYIQHAPVNLNFPALYHDINILFSQDSLDKYRREIDVEVKIACDLRFLNNYDKYNLEEENNTILICPNALDNFNVIDQLIQYIPNKYKVLLRPHPNDNRRWNEIKSCTLSKNFNIWDDLVMVDTVITNESAVVLEAIFLSRRVYKASFFSKSLDHYSFLKKGLLKKEHNSIASLIKAIQNKDIDFSKEELEYFIGHPENAMVTLKSVFT